LLGELTAFAVAPPALLLAASATTSPMWVPRYVMFVTVPLVLLAAATLRGRRASAVVAIAVLVAVALPAQILVRGVIAHDGPAFRPLGRIVVANQFPGDGIVYSESGNWTLRIGMERQLVGRPRPVDLLAARSAIDVANLGPEECVDVAACIGKTKRVWLVRLGERTNPLTPEIGMIAPVMLVHYRLVRIWHVTNGTIALYAHR
jgi:mannosyltransferase